MWINQLFSYWTRQLFAPGTLLRKKYQYFRDLLALDRYCLEKMAEIEEIYYRGSPCDYARVVRLCRELDQGAGNLIKSIIALNPIRYRVLKEYHRKVSFYLENSLSIDEPPIGPPFIVGLDPENGQGQNASLMGGKALNLSIIKEKNLPAPEGFCITTRAYNAIVAANGLRPRINDTLSRVCLDSIEDLEEKCHTLQQLFLDAQIPDHIQKEIDEKLIGFPGKKLAVRSSAFGEDGRLSFAGQYKSLLNVSPENFTDAYKQVLAGKYSPRAITYRIHEGLPDESLPMAVLVLEMIDALESGVVYSSGIKDKDEMGIYIVSGLGDKLVSGAAAAREIYIDKKKDFDFSSGHQPYIKELYDQALKLEQLFENPQDVEWALDKAGSLKLLQTRPLHAIKPANDAPRLDLPVLAKGEWASPGLVSGKIYTLKSGKGIHSDISRIPKGAVVVVGGLYPELTAALGKIDGIIAREGSAAGHFATIARESSIPIVINVANALELFEDGQLVTIDGNRGLVHDGKADKTTLYPVKKETWLTDKMEKILEIVSSLNLKDAQSEEFIPQNCRSMHDLIRFIHEMGVREMFSLSERKGRGLYQAKVLDIDIPMSFRVLNLENGLTDKGDAQRRISLNDVICKPFKAMFTGLAHEKIEWDQNIKHFDWEEFDKVSAGIFNPAESSLLSSYGLIAKDYMHALIRFGYHFVVVDSLLVEEPEQNYIQFSFKGGGGERSQKEMRLETIRIILEKYGFDIVVRGDLLEAQYERKNYEDTKRRLTVIGFVLGRTRLMDMSMRPEKVKSIAETLTGEIDEILAV